MTLEVSKMLREDFLQQNSFNEIDWYSSLDRQYRLLALILNYDAACRDAISRGLSVSDLAKLPVREQIGRAKSVPDDRYSVVYTEIEGQIQSQIAELLAKAGADQDD